MPPVVVIDPVVLLEDCVTSVTARLTGTVPNRLSMVSFLEALSLLSTIANTSADAAADNEDHAENFTSALG